MDKRTVLIGNSSGQCKTQTADCKLWTRGKMKTEDKMQTPDLGLNADCRLRNSDFFIESCYHFQH